MTTDIHWQCGAMNVASKTYGDPKNPWVIALHGWLDNAASFDALAPLLKDVYVIALDLPGHGHSDAMTSPDHYTIAHYADVVAQIIQQSHHQPIRLLGHSLGGGIAAFIASQHPSFIDSVIMIDVLGPLSSEKQDTEDNAENMLRSMRDAASRARKKTYASLEDMIHIRARVNHLPVSRVQPMVERGVCQTEDGWMWVYDHALTQKTKHPLSESQVLSILANIQCPVMVIEASEGIFKGEAYHSKRFKALTHAHHALLTGHHHIHMECPSKVADIISEFYSYLSTVATKKKE